VLENYTEPAYWHSLKIVEIEWNEEGNMLILVRGTILPEKGGRWGRGGGHYSG